MADAVLDAPPAVTPVQPGPSAAPRSTGSIQVSSLPQPATPAAPPKPGSAREKLFESLRQKAKPEPSPASNQPAPSPSPAEPVEPETPAAAPAGASETPEAPATPPAEPATEPEGKKKTSPWKLVDQWKSRATQLETEVAELRKSVLPEAERAKETERVKKLETRAKELEDEIRFVNYSKSQEFQEKYQQPYETAWKKWMADLGEIPVAVGEGQEPRLISPQDVLSLMNMPLAQARQLALASFGDFADDVMAARKELRSLFDAQNTALEEARKNGSTREAERAKQHKEFIENTQKTIKQTWDSANAAALADEKFGTYFKPVEGDQEGNQRLAKGLELVDRAYGENPLDPNLTPEQRAAVVRRHAAVRNRAAAAGRLIYWLSLRDNQIAELKKELARLKGSEPSTTPPNGQAAPAPGPARAWDTVTEGLRKIAK